MATTHLVTAKDLLAMGSDARFELIEGVLKEVSSSSSTSSVFAYQIGNAVFSLRVPAHS